MLRIGICGVARALKRLSWMWSYRLPHTVQMTEWLRIGVLTLKNWKPGQEVFLIPPEKHY